MTAEKVYKARAELRRMTKSNLLKMAFHQKEKNCVLGGACPFLLEYQSILFCISEIMGKGCQVEKLRMDSDESGQSEDERARNVPKDMARENQGPLAGLWNLGNGQ
jgi:hypothetical protein